MKELLINVPTKPKTPHQHEQVRVQDEWLGKLEHHAEVARVKIPLRKEFPLDMPDGARGDIFTAKDNFRIQSELRQRARRMRR